jgi:hypothetical protein
MWIAPALGKLGPRASLAPPAASQPDRECVQRQHDEQEKEGERADELHALPHSVYRAVGIVEHEEPAGVGRKARGHLVLEAKSACELEHDRPQLQIHPLSGTGLAVHDPQELAVCDASRRLDEIDHGARGEQPRRRSGAVVIQRGRSRARQPFQVLR